MNRIGRGIALALFFATTGVIQADDPPKKAPPAQQEHAAKTPAEKFAAAKKASQEATDAVNKIAAEIQKRGERPSPEHKEIKEAFQAHQKAMQEVIKAAEALAQEDPTSAAGLEAINMVIRRSGATPAIAKVLTEHYAATPKINQIIGQFYYYEGQESNHLVALMNSVIEKNPSRDIQANATLILAKIKMYAHPKEAALLFETVLEKFKDLPNFNNTYGKRATSNLFELRHLQVGQVVPDIEGEDVDGKKFKLSDYRGKVVMLDFWGHW